MFKWYQQAAICYVYLADVETISQIRTSRWFARGWTLQELIAPHDVRFYSASWQYLGDKLKLCDQISEITGIQPEVLSTGQFEQITISRRMCWAANRKTTRVEDASYCLLGIFNVNMPLLYGEGSKAFIRLQESIMKVSDDQTLFAWNLPTDVEDDTKSQDLPMLGGSLAPKSISVPMFSRNQACGLLANSPTQFLSQHQIRVLPHFPVTPAAVVSNGVQIELPVVSSGAEKFAILPCTVEGRLDAYLGFSLYGWDERWHARVGKLVLLAGHLMDSAKTQILLIKEPVTRPAVSLLPLFRLQLNAEIRGLSLSVKELYCMSHVVRYDDYTMEIRNIRGGPFGIYFLSMKSNEEFSEGRRLPDIEFAVIVGLSAADLKLPWLALVPLLRFNHVDEDFHTWLQIDSQLVRWCMTANQLKELFDKFEVDEMPFLAGRTVHLRQCLREWTKKWSGQERKFSGQSSAIGDVVWVYKCQYQRKEWINLIMGFEVVQKNLAEKSTSVNVNLKKGWERTKETSRKHIKNDFANV